MPFTIFHLGPGIGLGLPLNRYLHPPTFIFANIFIDLEPLLVLILGLRSPLHGYLHTLPLAALTGLALSYIMYLIEGFLHPLYRFFLLESESNLSFKSFIMAGISGAVLHVLLDSPLYGDIKPLYPVTINPLYNPALTPEIYCLCIFLGIFGILYYLWMIGSAFYKRLRYSKR